MLNIPYPDLAQYSQPSQQHLDWLQRCGVSLSALTKPPMVLLARGHKAHDGAFEADAGGEEWLVFPEAQDCIFWQPRGGMLARWNGRAFALGEDMIHAAATCSFGNCLNIYNSPLDWLRADRDGIVIIDWHRAFDELRHCPRVAVVESLLDKVEQNLRPSRLPEILVLREQREVIA